ncbi:acyl-CoA dehydrogenase C-terminal domain-containing protein [Nocardia kruczakiae]|uniref:acyl-CoA dehydrogenase C-terminal domain-containing protein n=1 Tax=Nocardia kruczakiae TaxID=261477 RepID=UPI0007A4D98D
MKNEEVLLSRALEDVQEIIGRLTAHLLAAAEEPPVVYKIGPNAVRFLLAVGDLLVAWRLIVAAETALTTIEAGQNTAFYAGKVAVASFFANSVLPHATAELAVVSATDATVMDLAEAGF